MDFQRHIVTTSLRSGDIILMEDHTHRFFKNIAVVTQIDQQNEDCRVALWKGTRYPYTLTEMPLPSGEAIREDNLALHVFRPKDQDLAQRTVTLLRKWCLWAVPFSKTQFRQAEEYNNNVFGIDADFLNDQIPNMFDCSLFNQKMDKNCEFLNQKFKENYLDVVKYAARRDISPVRPTVENEEKQPGFHFAQGILIAFQIACVQNFVKPQNTVWTSNKESLSFKPVQKALKSNFDQKAFLNCVPPAFQLWAKLASIETFNTVLRNDYENILPLGILVPQNSVRAYDFDKQEYENITLAYQIGLQRRSKLMQSINDVDEKPKSDSIKNKLYKTCSRFF